MGNGRVRGSDVGIRGWEWKELGLRVGGGVWVRVWGM